MFGGIFSDYLEGPWEQVRGYLREHLEQLQSTLTAQWAAIFDTDGTLKKDAIDGTFDTGDGTFYLSSEGTKGKPKWAKVNLDQGVKNRLRLSNFATADAGTLLGRNPDSDGNYEPITVGAGLQLSGTVLSAQESSSGGQFFLAESGSGDDGSWSLTPQSTGTGSGSSGTVTNTGTLTANAVLIGNGGSDITALASLGTSGHVLTSNGAGVAPSFQAVSGGSGGWSLLQTYTPSGAASVDITSVLSSTYDDYVIYLSDLVTNQTATYLGLQVSIDNGATWLASTTYRTNYQSWASDASPAQSHNSTGEAQMRLGSINVGGNIWCSGTGRAASGKVELFGLNSTIANKYIRSAINFQQVTDVMIENVVQGRAYTTSPVNAVKLTPAAGTVSGTFRVYGLAK